MKVLLVEDDGELASFVARVLREEGFEVSIADSARAALTILKQETFNLAILDRMLPDQDGLAVCAEIRRRELDVGVLMLTARGELEDRVGGLEAGADDYIVKPFEVEELIAGSGRCCDGRNPRPRSVRCTWIGAGGARGSNRNAWT